MARSPIRVALVSCVKTKRETAAPAKDLYTSPLFRSLRTYAEGNADAWYILSAKHGVLHPDEVTAPYEQTLNRMAKSARDGWAAKVLGELAHLLPVGAEVILLAGMNYRKGIEATLKQGEFVVSVPLEGLRLGQQLAWLKRQSMDRHVR